MKLGVGREMKLDKKQQQKYKTRKFGKLMARPE
jgi:hypothetical protein